MDGMDERRMGSRRKELTAPCRDCEERKPGCHDKCGKFREFRATLEKKREYDKETGCCEIKAPLRRWRWG